jgi:putative Mn2+ efflux pump MntP
MQVPVLSPCISGEPSDSKKECNFLGIITLVMLAFGLAMDAFAVSVSNGISFKKAGLKEAFWVSFFFGFFQGLMPLLGYGAGQSLAQYIERFGYIIAFVFLAGIGINMIINAVSENKDSSCPSSGQPFSFKLVFMQAIATSIDALAVGISFAAIKINISLAVALIAVITFFCCFIGVLIGIRCGKLLKKKAEILGGVILIIIGLKILLESMLA